MCAICDKFKAGEITSKQALLLAPDLPHGYDLVDLVMEKELPSSEPDPEMDAIYQNKINES